jgi:hypothetical protein
MSLQARGQLRDNRRMWHMRHAIGFVLALLLSAAIYFGGGWSVARLIHANGHGLVGVSGALTLAALAGTGLLIGLLVAGPAVSPIASGLPGLALVGWTALMVVRTSQAVRLIPMPSLQASAGIHTMLLSGVLGLLGMVMIAPMLVPSRWRRRERMEEFSVPAEAELVHY